MAGAMEVTVGSRALHGFLDLPEAARGLVIFAHGSGSSRLSPRNRFAADVLNHFGFATLLFDLLTEEESRDRRNVFDIRLLASRVVEAIDWARSDARTFVLPIGLFGASTGAAAAIVAAVERPEAVLAVVSRGGRPDLAGEALKHLRAPILLIVGGDDREVLTLNRSVDTRLNCEKSLTVVAGATHLFEEEGALEEALAAAGQWYERHLRDPPAFFDDRPHAGRLLAARLVRFASQNPAVYALPRGGAPVAAEIAQELGAPLDLLLVRKIGVPWQPELAAGAVVDGEKPDVVLNHDIIAAASLSEKELSDLTEVELKEIERRRKLYLGDRAPVSARGRTAILVDDGVATGASMEAALIAIRRRAPQRIVVAVPVASREAAKKLRGLADEVVCLSTPEDFLAIGQFYRDFHQLEDAEVTELLTKFAAPAD